jgi:hypothetical protein
MRDRHGSQEPPYALFLGTGAALVPGSTPSRLKPESILAREGVTDPAALTEDEQIEAFFALLEDSSEEKRDQVLQQYLREAVQCAGHTHLANLVVNGYFRTLVTSSFDTLLEEALYGAGLWSDSLRILNLQQDDIPVQKRGGGRSIIELIKLRGDPYSPGFWDSQRKTRYAPRTKRLLSRALGQDLIMVGHHSRDSFVAPFLESGDGQLVYVNPVEPSNGPTLSTNARDRVSEVISGEYGHFDAFFGTLAGLLLYRPSRITVAQEVDTVREGGTVVGVDLSQSYIGSSVAIGDDVHLDKGIQIGDIVSESDPITDSELHDPDTERLDSLRSQLGALQETYYPLQREIAMYGAGNAPLRLLNQLEATREQIRQLESEIGRLSGQED